MPLINTSFSTFSAAEAALKALGADRMKLGTERIERVLVALGNPQNTLATIHVVGSNGKGSTSAILASIYEAAGYRVGLFTSPHLVSVRERIQLNRRPIPEDTFTALFNRIFDCLKAEDISLSYFECLTVLGFLYYEQEAVDIAIIEAGLGGRLDSTNVLAAPRAVVVTPISLDHTDLLGETLEAIATEKTAVFKAGTPVISAPQATAVENVITKKATDCGVQPLMTKTDGWQAGALDLTHATRHIRGQGLQKTASDEPSEISFHTRLCGAYQCENMAVARAVVQALIDSFPVSEAAYIQGLSSAFWPGRYHVLPEQNLIVDGSHNAAGLAALRACLENDFPREPLHIGVTLLSSKPLSCLDELLKTSGQCQVASITALIPPSDAESTKAFRPSDTIAAYCQALAPNAIIKTQALEEWLASKPDTGLRVLTGSLYSLGQALPKTP